MSSLLQKKSIGVKIENTPETEQLGHSDLPFACVKRSLSVKTFPLHVHFHANQSHLDMKDSAQ